MDTSLTGISSMATRGLLADVVEAWQRRGGAKLRFESVGGVDAAKRVSDGERFDVVVLAADAIGRLAAEGRVVPGSERALARSGVAVAVRRGARVPAIQTEAALREAVLAARTLGYSTGPSGAALLKLFARWGIDDVLRPRLVQAPAGIAVATLLARGDAELGFQQLSELIHADGIAVIGPMPPGLEIDTVFSGAVCATSAQPDAAAALLDFIGSPAADEARRRHGLRAA